MADTSYKNILKSTFLFGFVQIFNIIVKIALNKIVAVLLGTEGMGIISQFNTSINLLKTGGGLGISQSVVRDISEANACGDNVRFSRTISLTNRIIRYTGLLGVVLTVVLSPWLSEWVFGSDKFSLAFVGLSLAVGVNILIEGQLAILKGMRQLKALAKASMFGAIFGLIFAVPFYYFYGNSGIVPSLIVTAITALILSNYYVRKIKYERVTLSLTELKTESSSMVKMGIALMFVSFFGFLSDLIISSYISHHGGLGVVGLYQAGATIISGYFGIIITAMSTDYYPRISAIHTDDVKLQHEVNRQSEVGLVLMYPLVIVFLFAMPIFIRILYSTEFLEAIDYLRYAVIGVVITICSNSMGMILLAKQKSHIFIYTSSIQKVLTIVISLLAYNNYGLSGLGISYLVMAVIHIILMALIMNICYRIKFSKYIYYNLCLIIISAVIVLVVKSLDNVCVEYSVGVILFIASLFYLYYILRKKMNIRLPNFKK